MGRDLETVPERWTSSAGRDYLVEFRFALVDGRPECVGFEVRSFMSDDEILQADEYNRYREQHPAEGVDPPRDPLPPIDADPTPLNAVLLREVPFGDLLRSARQRLQARESFILRYTTVNLAERGRNEEESRRLAEAKEVLEGIPRGRRYDREDYEAVARIYTEAETAGQAPRQAVANHFKISPSAAAKLVARVRNDMHLLPPTKKGRSRGQLITEETSQ